MYNGTIILDVKYNY